MKQYVTFKIKKIYIYILLFVLVILFVVLAIINGVLVILKSIFR